MLVTVVPVTNSNLKRLARFSHHSRSKTPTGRKPMSDVSIRMAQVSEHRWLEELQMRASLGNEGDREALLANPDAVQTPIEQIHDGRLFVAELEGRIVGFAALEWTTDNNAELDALFVEPTMQRHGIGRALIQHCKSVAKDRGMTAILVIGNLHAEGFYKATGFRSLGAVKTRFGAGLRMRLDL
jgi:N-acetylglutamate synthase-like GNAT family acetyltransferase